MSADDIQQLQAIFPDASAEALAAVLELSGDVAVATDYLLSNEGALEEVENGLRAGQGNVRMPFSRGTLGISECVH